jgi:hypothetical protein
MKSAIPPSLAKEHDELHAELAAATKLPGAVGEAARSVARLLHPHFVKEEEFALPPLGLLVPLAGGPPTQDMLSIAEMTDRLKDEMPIMLAEHQAIVAALKDFEKAGLAEHDEQAVRLAEKIINHAQTEEEVMYPAAILVGEYIKAKLRAG